eukprot:scaffold31656_cov27-Tisochrysis_lutea.AAC.1
MSCQFYDTTCVYVLDRYQRPIRGSIKRFCWRARTPCRGGVGGGMELGRHRFFTFISSSIGRVRLVKSS